MVTIPFGAFVASLTDLGGVLREDPVLKERMKKIVTELAQVSREQLDIRGVEKVHG